MVKELKNLLTEIFIEVSIQEGSLMVWENTTGIMAAILKGNSKMG